MHLAHRRGVPWALTLGIYRILISVSFCLASPHHLETATETGTWLKNPNVSYQRDRKGQEWTWVNHKKRYKFKKHGARKPLITGANSTLRWGSLRPLPYRTVTDTCNSDFLPSGKDKIVVLSPHLTRTGIMLRMKEFSRGWVFNKFGHRYGGSFGIRKLIGNI